MAGSRRRTRQNRTSKVRVGVRKVASAQHRRAPLPVELKLAAAAAAAAAAGSDPTGLSLAGGKLAAPAWNVTAPPSVNYAAAGLAVNPNKRTGRNAPTGGVALEAKAAAIAAGTLLHDSDNDDDDLRSAEGKPRADGRKRSTHTALTATQAGVIGRLVAAHGVGNVSAMARDTKLNRMLLPPSKLRVLVEAWQAAGVAGEGGVRCRFSAPIKSLGLKK